MLPNITFIKGQGGLGRPLPGQDFISGLIFYSGVLPSGFTTAKRILQFFSAQDAINAGITNQNPADAVAATASYQFSSQGVAGDIIKISVNELDATGQPRNTVLCNYTALSSDSSILLLGASVTAAINALAPTTGYSATFSVDTITITAPNKLGIFLNTGSPLVVAITGTIAGAITNFAGGVASNFAHFYYQISEFFRQQPQGVLYVGIFDIPGLYTFAEVATMQNTAGGTIRQIGILKDPASAYAHANLAAIQSVCVPLDVLHKPISTALYAANLISVADITTLNDLSLDTAFKVSSVIGMDAGGNGWFLFKTIGSSVPCLGAALGTVALAKVSESIAWVGKFNISNGVEDEVLAFANGQLFDNSSISASLENIWSTLNDKRYIFLKKFTGISGSYFNDSPTAISSSNDYAQIENNRTIDKAIRGIYSSLLPSLNSPLRLNADGTLAETTIAALEAQANVNLDQMVRDGELGAFEVLINPSQNVLSTSKIVITVELVINGVARQIEVGIGFTPKIS